MWDTFLGLCFEKDTPSLERCPVLSIIHVNLEDLSISAGTTVNWTNQAGLPHTTTAGVPGAPSGEWDSGPLARGQSFSQTFDSPGSFPYFCMIHQWMTGTVTVTG